MAFVRRKYSLMKRDYIHRSDWIQTYSGGRICSLDPLINEISIVDIAHALSNNCRFTGHTIFHYSVAQHCVLCCLYAPEEFKLECLLHDASEAYLADLARPVKRVLTEYVKYERILEETLARKFKLKYPFPNLVKEIDNRMLETERRDCLSKKITGWTDTAEPYKEKILPWTPLKAELEFINLYHANKRCN